MTRHPNMAATLAVALIVAAVSLTSCGESMLSCIQGSDVFKSDVRRAPGENPAVDPFTVIRLEGEADVILTEGPYSIVVEGDDNLVGMITTYATDNILWIDNEECYASNRPVVVRVSLPKLEAVEVNGAGDVTATTAFTTDRLRIFSNGSGDIALGVEAAKVETISKGSGDITLNGHAALHTVDMRGSGDLSALQLQTERTEYSSSGSGDGRIAVSQALVVSMSGSGDLAYRGTPTEYQANVTGSGELSRIP